MHAHDQRYPAFSFRMKSWIPDCYAQQAQEPFPVAALPVEMPVEADPTKTHDQQPLGAVVAQPSRQEKAALVAQMGY